MSRSFGLHNEALGLVLENNCQAKEHFLDCRYIIQGIDKRIQGQFTSYVPTKLLEEGDNSIISCFRVIVSVPQKRSALCAP